MRGRGSTWRRLLILAAVALILAGTGCASRDDRLERELDGLVGRATTGDVLRSWGEPERRIRADDAELWLYRHVLLQFDRAGRLRGWHRHAD